MNTNPVYAELDAQRRERRLRRARGALQGLGILLLAGLVLAGVAAGLVSIAKAIAGDAW